MLDKIQAEQLLNSLLNQAYSKKFLNKILRKNINFRKGWFRLTVVMNSGNSFTLSISEDGTKFRNTVRYYRRNRITKVHPQSEGLLSNLTGFTFKE